MKNMLIIPRYFVIFAPGMKERGVILTTPTVEFAQGGAERFRKFPGEGMTEDEMVGWHHRLNGHGFE